MGKLAWTLLIVVALKGWTQEPASQPGKDGIYSPGGDVKPPKLVHTAPAQFPADPRLNGMKYRCIVGTVIDVNGKPTSMQVEEAGTGSFGAAAIEAVKQSEFKPGSLHGNPVPVRVEVWVPFMQGEKHAVPELLPMTLFHNEKDNRPAIALLSPQPGYTDAARKVYFVGTAVVHTIVNERGIPEDIRIVQSVGHGLDEKAIEAASGWRFAPALRWGIPVPFSVNIEFQFRPPR